MFLLALHTMRTCTMHSSVTQHTHVPLALHQCARNVFNVAQQGSVCHHLGLTQQWWCACSACNHGKPQVLLYKYFRAHGCTGRDGVGLNSFHHGGHQPKSTWSQQHCALGVLALAFPVPIEGLLSRRQFKDTKTAPNKSSIMSNSQTECVC